MAKTQGETRESRIPRRRLAWHELGPEWRKIPYNDIVPEDVDIDDVNEVLSQIPGLNAVKIIVDGKRMITEVHCTSIELRSPQELVRDIETVLYAKWGLKIDHRRIGVCVFKDMPQMELEALIGRRLKIERVYLNLGKHTADSIVELGLQGRVYTGTAVGPATKYGQYQVVAQATIAAVEAFLRTRSMLSAGEVRLIKMLDEDVVLVSVSVIGMQGEERLVGTAPVRSYETDAVARATMDAINRRLLVWKSEVIREAKGEPPPFMPQLYEAKRPRVRPIIPK
ncbi:MAG: hypothetical protein ACM3ZU_10175 [Bacteroidota bacterium]